MKIYAVALLLTIGFSAKAVNPEILLAGWIHLAQDANPGVDRVPAIQKLGKVLARSNEAPYPEIWQNLKLYHDAVFALTQIQLSEPGLAQRAAKTLLTQGERSAWNSVINDAKRESDGTKVVNEETLPQDVIIFLTTNIGREHNFTNKRVEKLTYHANPKVRMAFAIWISNHFTSASPSEGFLPVDAIHYSGDLARHLEASDGWFYQSDAHLGYMKVTPLGKALARIKFDSENDPSKEVREVCWQAWSLIERELNDAIGSAPIDRKNFRIKSEVQKIRKELAQRWLSDVHEISKDWISQEQDALSARTDDPVTRLIQAARGLTGAPPRPNCQRIILPSKGQN